MRTIGFMQGRLSERPHPRIQAFPKDTWREEFVLAQRHGFSAIELIYDDLHLEYNPLASTSGRRELRDLARQTGIKLHSICADYFMQKLLLDRDGKLSQQNLEHALELFRISDEIGCKLVEFPFVDSSSLLRYVSEPKRAAEQLIALTPGAESVGIRIAFETDLPPLAFRAFLSHFPAPLVGANFDLGNSAALGYDSRAECLAFGERILNVHIKDRKLGDTTVALGSGATDFDRAFSALAKSDYRGDFILQTFPGEDYVTTLIGYKSFTQNLIDRHFPR